MPGGEERAREYVAEMRRRGFAEAEIAGALREAGWGEEQAARIMAEAAALAEERKQSGPAPGLPGGLPPPPPSAPPARKGLSTGAIVAIVVGVGCAVLLPAFAILAAILFPVFGHAREQARQNACQTNVKQLMMGQLIYAIDYDEHLPPASDWPQNCLPYVASAQVYLCPSDRRPAKQRSGDLETSYTMSAAAGDLHLSAVNPMALAVMFDGTEIAGGREAAEARHVGGLNVGYADGHTKCLSYSMFLEVPLSPSEAAWEGRKAP